MSNTDVEYTLVVFHISKAVIILPTHKKTDIKPVFYESRNYLRIFFKNSPV